MQPKIYYGNYRWQMSLLVKDGFKPATAADIMRLKLDDIIPFNEYYYTATGIAYAGNNEDRFKIIPFSEELKRANLQTKLYNGGIELSPEQYGGIEAAEFARKNMILRIGLTKEEVLKPQQGLLEFVGGDLELLTKYTEEVLRRLSTEKAMDFYIHKPQEVPNLRAFFLGGLGLGSRIFGGRYSLDYDGSRLLGVV